MVTAPVHAEDPVSTVITDIDAHAALQQAVLNSLQTQVFLVVFLSYVHIADRNRHPNTTGGC